MSKTWKKGQLITPVDQLDVVGSKLFQSKAEIYLENGLTYSVVSTDDVYVFVEELPEMRFLKDQFREVDSIEKLQLNVLELEKIGFKAVQKLPVKCDPDDESDHYYYRGFRCENKDICVEVTIEFEKRDQIYYKTKHYVSLELRSENEILEHISTLKQIEELVRILAIQ